ncbi:10749_t:CDS:2 [Entrophospora sp. SA101]|nr:10749_t:CDS:2 [Entrophospora sp. SA101]
MYLNQIGQVLGRLFPFKRGLCHAYWAPNFWALYSALDRVLIVAGKQLGLELNEAAVDSVTRGLFSLIKLWKFPTYMNFLKSLISCGYSSFLFGWHVHEKAVLLVLIPFSLIVSENYHLLRTFMILSTSGLISLLPLLFKATGFKAVINYVRHDVDIYGGALLNKLSPTNSSKSFNATSIKKFFTISVVTPATFSTNPFKSEISPSLCCFVSNPEDDHIKSGILLALPTTILSNSSTILFINKVTFGPYNTNVAKQL